MNDLKLVDHQTKNIFARHYFSRVKPESCTTVGIVFDYGLLDEAVELIIDGQEDFSNRDYIELSSLGTRSGHNETLNVPEEIISCYMGE